MARNGTLELIAKLDRTAGAALVSTAAGKGLTVTGTSLNVSGGAVNVKDGLTLNKDGMVNVSGGTLVVDGATTWTPVSGGTSGKLTISSGSVTLQKSSILNADYGLAAQITDKANQLGLSGGTLLLTSADDYTVDQLKKAKTTLTGISTLGFLGGKLVDNAGEAETLVVDASTSGGVISGSTDIKAGIVNVGKADGNNLFAENSMNVALGANATAQAQATLNAKDINLVTDGSVAPTTLAVSTGNVTWWATSPASRWSPARMALRGQAGCDCGCEQQRHLQHGPGSNSQNQGGLVDELNVVGGTANVNGNGAGTSDYTINSLSMTGPGAQVNATNTTLSIGEWNAQNGTLYVDPAYVDIAGLTGGTLGATLLVGDGSVVNIGGMSGADLRTALAEAGMSVGPNLTLGDGQSALALDSPVTVSGAGKIVVDARVDASGKIDSAAVNHQPTSARIPCWWWMPPNWVLTPPSLVRLAVQSTIAPSLPPTPTCRWSTPPRVKSPCWTLCRRIASDELGGTDFGWVKNSVANPDRMLTSTLRWTPPLAASP